MISKNRAVVFRSPREGIGVLLGIGALVMGAADIVGTPCADVALAQSPSMTYHEAEGIVRNFDVRPLFMAIADLTATFGSRYTDGPQYLARLKDLERSRADLVARLNVRDETSRRGVVKLAGRLEKPRRKALLANRFCLGRTEEPCPKIGCRWRAECAALAGTEAFPRGIVHK